MMDFKGPSVGFPVSVAERAGWGNTWNVLARKLSRRLNRICRKLSEKW